MAHQKITEQIELMQQALQYQKDIETITKLVKKFYEVCDVGVLSNILKRHLVLDLLRINFYF